MYTQNSKEFNKNPRNISVDFIEDDLLEDKMLGLFEIMPCMFTGSTVSGYTGDGNPQSHHWSHVTCLKGKWNVIADFYWRRSPDSLWRWVRTWSRTTEVKSKTLTIEQPQDGKTLNHLCCKQATTIEQDLVLWVGQIHFRERVIGRQQDWHRMSS